MAATYSLIASNTLGSDNAAIEFTSISSAYTDLVLRYSLRTDSTGTKQDIYLTLNSDTGSNYNYIELSAQDATPRSTLGSSQANILIYQGATDNSGTSNTFSNGEIYIPNYTISTNKPIEISIVTENNSTNNNILVDAGLWVNTAAITSIKIEAPSGLKFKTNSSIFLYGIKKS